MSLPFLPLYDIVVEGIMSFLNVPDVNSFGATCKRAHAFKHSTLPFNLLNKVMLLIDSAVEHYLEVKNNDGGAIEPKQKKRRLNNDARMSQQESGNYTKETLAGLSLSEMKKEKELFMVLLHKAYCLIEGRRRNAEILSHDIAYYMKKFVYTDGDEPFNEDDSARRVKIEYERSLFEQGHARIFSFFTSPKRLYYNKSSTVVFEFNPPKSNCGDKCYVTLMEQPLQLNYMEIIIRTDSVLIAKSLGIESGKDITMLINKFMDSHTEVQIFPVFDKFNEIMGFPNTQTSIDSIAFLQRYSGISYDDNGGPNWMFGNREFKVEVYPVFKNIDTLTTHFEQEVVHLLDQFLPYSTFVHWEPHLSTLMYKQLNKLQCSLQSPMEINVKTLNQQYQPISDIYALVSDKSGYANLEYKNNCLLPLVSAQFRMNKAAFEAKFHIYVVGYDMEKEEEEQEEEAEAEEEEEPWVEVEEKWEAEKYTGPSTLRGKHSLNVYSIEVEPLNAVSAQLLYHDESKTEKVLLTEDSTILDLLKRNLGLEHIPNNEFIACLCWIALSVEPRLEPMSKFSMRTYHSPDWCNEAILSNSMAFLWDVIVNRLDRRESEFKPYIYIGELGL
jgi:hypothetical protein